MTFTIVPSTEMIHRPGIHLIGEATTTDTRCHSRRSIQVSLEEKAKRF
jgi:hypothetical protein